jgi:hypothetical protein
VRARHMHTHTTCMHACMQALLSSLLRMACSEDCTTTCMACRFRTKRARARRDVDTRAHAGCSSVQALHDKPEALPASAAQWYRNVQPCVRTNANVCHGAHHVQAAGIRDQRGVAGAPAGSERLQPRAGKASSACEPGASPRCAACFSRVGAPC